MEEVEKEIFLEKRIHRGTFRRKQKGATGWRR